MIFHLEEDYDIMTNFDPIKDQMFKRITESNWFLYGGGLRNYDELWSYQRSNVLTLISRQKISVGEKLREKINEHIRNSFMFIAFGQSYIENNNSDKEPPGHWISVVSVSPD